MTDPYDPYRPNPNSPYGQSGPPGNPPYGGSPYGPQPGGPPQGQPPYGPPPYGQPQPGPSPYGAPPYGQPPQGQPPQGQPPYGQPDQTRQFDPYPGAQQPYQGSYGQPSGWAGQGGGFTPQPPPKSKAPIVLIAVLAVVILIGGGIAVALVFRGGAPSAGGTSSTTASTAAKPTTASQQPTSGEPTATATTAPSGGTDFKVGQCATLTPEANNRATIRVTECGGALSDVVISKIESGECAQPYLSFNPGEGKVYCLAMDAKEGDCFRFDHLIKRALACVGDDARKVVRIYDDVADDAKCSEVPETVDVYTYPDPARTICLGPADF